MSPKTIIIGCSAGGREYLDILVPQLELRNNFLIITPHIETTTIYDSLSKNTNHDIRKIPKNPEKMVCGAVYLAVDEISETGLVGSPYTGSHMRAQFEGSNIKTDSCDVDSNADPSMISAARAYGSNTIGVLLSGCGCDGAKGLGYIKSKSGITLVQIENKGWPYLYIDEMPQNAIKEGVVDFSGTIDEIVAKLNELCGSD